MKSSVLTVTKILIFDPYNRDHFSILEHLKKFLIVHQTNIFNGKTELYWTVTPGRLWICIQTDRTVSLCDLQNKYAIRKFVQKSNKYNICFSYHQAKKHIWLFVILHVTFATHFRYCVPRDSVTFASIFKGRNQKLA